MEENQILNISENCDDRYLEDFRRVLWSIDDEEVLYSFLPDSKCYGYTELINYLLEYSKNESIDILNELEVVKDDGDIQYLKGELELARKRISFFDSKLKENDELIENCLKPSMGRQLIYLKSKAGNPLIESDFENIPIDEISDMKAAFDYLKNGVFSSDQTKYRVLKNIKGVRETKGIDSRIFFYHIEKDIFIVFLALLKKGTNPKREYEKIVNRTQSMFESLREIKADLANDEKRENILLEGREITERLDNILNPKKLSYKL